MVRLASFVLLAIALVTSSSPLRPRTAAQIETDLNNIISSVVNRSLIMISLDIMTEYS